MSYKPPKRGDKLFIGDECDMNDIHARSILPQIQPQVIAFQEAAELLLDQIIDQENRTDILFLPIVYLYRHSVELYLKEIIRYGVRMKCVQKNEKLEALLSGHSLMPLFNKVKDVVSKFGEVDDALRGAESMINQLHELDPNGQTLRYAVSKDRTKFHRYQSLPDWISKSHLRDRMQSLCDYLAGCIDWLDSLESAGP